MRTRDVDLADDVRQRREGLPVLGAARFEGLEIPVEAHALLVDVAERKT